MEFQLFEKFYETLLHLAYESKDIDIIKYLISLNKIDVRFENILKLIFFIMFECDDFNTVSNLKSLWNSKIKIFFKSCIDLAHDDNITEIEELFVNSIKK